MLGTVIAPYTDPQNDVYSRGQSNTVYMPSEGYPVYRTPSANAYENEPGSRWHGQPIRRFNHNGYEMTPVSLGAAVPSPAPPSALTVHLVKSIGPTLAAAVGAGFGVYLAPVERRPSGALVGALVGGILGVIFGR